MLVAVGLGQVEAAILAVVLSVREGAAATSVEPRNGHERSVRRVRTRRATRSTEDAVSNGLSSRLGPHSGGRAVFEFVYFLGK